MNKISKVTNKDKVQLKREVFITWEKPQVLPASIWPLLLQPVKEPYLEALKEEYIG